MQQAAKSGNGADLESILQKLDMMEPERGSFVPRQLMMDATTDPLMREIMKMMDAPETEPVEMGIRRHESRRRK